MNVAFIPVRGGSKSIPFKNIRSINGRPLVYWTLMAGCGSKHIDRVYVSTDSNEIRDVVVSIKENVKEELANKIFVIDRSPETASDTASTESAMLEFAANYDFENIVLIQATSPLLRSEDIDRGFEIFNEDGVDSVLSVVRQKRFNWAYDEKGFVNPTNYDVFKRPRRQEFDGYLVENGAFYISTKKRLIESKNRISGNIKAVEMDEDSFFEIDEPSDWVIIEQLMKKMKSDVIHSQIKLFLTDCDGCLTDAGMYYSEFGDELKKYNTRDGMAFKFLREKGIITGIITSENVELNRRRANKLKLDELIAGCTDKLSAVKSLCQKYNIKLENVLYIGDDVNDVEVLQSVGIGCAPADACYSARNSASYVTQAKGGEGVIREVVERILGI